MCGSMADIQSAAAEIKRGKKERTKKCGPMPNVMAALEQELPKMYIIVYQPRRRPNIVQSLVGFR